MCQTTRALSTLFVETVFLHIVFRNHRKIPAWCPNSPFHELGSSVSDDSSPKKREREDWRRLVMPHYREIDYQS